MILLQDVYLPNRCFVQSCGVFTHSDSVYGSEIIIDKGCLRKRKEVRDWTKSVRRFL